MDVTVGSGWSYGGPYITPDLASARLRSDRREIAPDRTSVARPVPFEGDRLVAAYIARGSLREVGRRGPSASWTSRATGRSRCRRETGRAGRLLLREPHRPGGQARGAGGRRLRPRPLPAARPSRRTCARPATSCWPPRARAACTRSSATASRSTTPTGRRTCSSEFQHAPRLRPAPAAAAAGPRPGRALAGPAPRLRAHAERALRGALPRSRCASGRAGTTCSSASRTTATRRPRISSARHADLIDGEGWNFRALTPSRWAASASHLFGKPVTTSETWTWLHSPAFRATPARREGGGGPALRRRHQPAHRPRLALFAARRPGTPGWPFYAAAVLSDKNPWWPVMPDLAAYLQRAELRPPPGRAGGGRRRSTRRAKTRGPRSSRGRPLPEPVPKIVGVDRARRSCRRILDAGHGFDLVRRRHARRKRRRAATRRSCCRACAAMPEATRRWLRTTRARGGLVLAVRRKPDGEWPGLDVVSEDDLSARLARGVTPDVALTPPDARDRVRPSAPRGRRRVLPGQHRATRRARVRARFRAATPHAESGTPSRAASSGWSRGAARSRWTSSRTGRAWSCSARPRAQAPSAPSRTVIAHRGARAPAGR